MRLARVKIPIVIRQKPAPNTINNKLKKQTQIKLKSRNIPSLACLAFCAKFRSPLHFWINSSLLKSWRPRFGAGLEPDSIMAKNCTKEMLSTLGRKKNYSGLPSMMNGKCKNSFFSKNCKKFKKSDLFWLDQLCWHGSKTWRENSKYQKFKKIYFSKSNNYSIIHEKVREILFILKLHSVELLSCG